jgi:multiple sugar transport system permease protein
VCVLLWRFFYDASATGCSTPSSAGRHRPAALAPVLGLSHAVDRHRGDLGGAGGDGDHLSRRAVERPPELYDAAEVDGASIWQKIRYVTLPQLRNVLFVTLILQLIATAQLFTEPLLFTAAARPTRR